MALTVGYQRTVQSQDRLAQLIRGVAAQPGSWKHLVRFSAERRWYYRLELADDYEIWLLSWLPGQHTGFHDHGEAAGAFAVTRGRRRPVPRRALRARRRHRRRTAGCERARLLAATDRDAPV